MNKNQEKKEDLSKLRIDYNLARRLPLNFVKRYRVLPLRRENGNILVGALKEGLSPHVIDDLRTLYNADIRFCYLEQDVFITLIASVYYNERETASGIIEGMKDKKPSLSVDADEAKDLLESTEEGPVIAFVNSLLSEAISKRASDIHIEPFEREIRVRCRIDGVLYKTLSLPKPLHQNISSRVKVMASLDVAEKRLPQDGRIRVKVGGKDIDIRASFVPTSFGERIVLRLLNREDINLDLEELGFEKREFRQFSRLIARDHGLILVTGPTGAGKTTSLYASLTRINSPQKNILTIEDPIEYQLKGIGQMHVNPKIGLTFARGLRHILRQDPDVIMVGEIRDKETADIAIHASLTGHLVFSTLHTNDAAGAITRLLDMGIEPYLVSSSLIGVLAQRLVRVLCPSCKKPVTIRQNSAVDLKGLKGDTQKLPVEGSGSQKALAPSVQRPEDVFASWCNKMVRTGKILSLDRGNKGISYYKSTGCNYCFKTGYIGRTGIYELLIVDDRIRSLIVERAGSSLIRKEAVSQGMSTIKRNGYIKVLNGITTIEEIIRVIQIDD